MDSSKSDKPKESWAATTEKSTSEDQRREPWKEGQAKGKEAGKEDTKEGKEGGSGDDENPPRPLGLAMTMKLQLPAQTFVFT